MVWPSVPFIDEYVDGPRPFNRCVTPPTRGDWVGGLSKVGGSVGLGPQLGMGQPNPAGGQLGRKCLRGFCLILGDFGWVVGITPRGGCGWVVGFFKKKKWANGRVLARGKVPTPNNSLHLLARLFTFLVWHHTLAVHLSHAVPAPRHQAHR